MEGGEGGQQRPPRPPRREPPADQSSGLQVRSPDRRPSTLQAGGSIVRRPSDHVDCGPDYLSSRPCLHAEAVGQSLLCS